MLPQEVWKAAKGYLEVNLHKNMYRAWIHDCEFVSFENDTFTISVKDDYKYDYISQRLWPAIRQALTRVYGQEVEVCFVLAEDSRPAPDLPSIPNVYPIQKKSSSAPTFTDDYAEFSRPNFGWKSNLNSNYTFSGFITGPNNQMAYEAAIQVIQNFRKTAYNPLVFYGDVGLGKTHLLHAIGNAYQKRGYKALYVTAEEFTNQMVDAIREKRMSEFRERYRYIDVLLIDDIQFVANKNSTQEELYHTFNALHDGNKQIVIAADRRPTDIKGLSKQLASRIAWGLAVSIQMPNYETRLAIVQKKAALQGFQLPEGVAEYLAEQPTQNIRELEGLLNQVSARASLLKLPLNLAIVEQIISEGHLQRDIHVFQRRLTVSQMIERAAAVMQIDLEEILGQSRKREIATARQWVIYLTRQETKASWPEIGIAMGRTHSTVLRSYQQLEKKIKADPALQLKAHEMRHQILQMSR
ncbi:MAG: chromosomal replication initiator protein DnaA [Phototrophicales bacterium]|nr:MAG: chromosomal replication initiator protein DnaA [Phototrophicales bacterium]